MRALGLSASMSSPPADLLLFLLESPFSWRFRLAAGLAAGSAARGAITGERTMGQSGGFEGLEDVGRARLSVCGVSTCCFSRFLSFSTSGLAKIKWSTPRTPVNFTDAKPAQAQKGPRSPHRALVLAGPSAAASRDASTAKSRARSSLLKPQFALGSSNKRRREELPTPLTPCRRHRPDPPPARHRLYNGVPLGEKCCR